MSDLIVIACPDAASACAAWATPAAQPPGLCGASVAAPGAPTPANLHETLTRT